MSTPNPAPETVSVSVVSIEADDYARLQAARPDGSVELFGLYPANSTSVPGGDFLTVDPYRGLPAGPPDHIIHCTRHHFPEPIAVRAGETLQVVVNPDGSAVGIVSGAADPCHVVG